MSENAFEQLEAAVASGDRTQAFQLLADQLSERKEYPQLFEARLLQKRLELGLPAIMDGDISNLSDETRKAYEEAYIQAAREVGELYLADGDIVHAWPYFRTIGEREPISTALEARDPREDELESWIEIAFHEQANPKRGFQLILDNYGTCNSITTFEQYPGREDRTECVTLLVDRIHADLLENLKAAIENHDSVKLESESIQEVIEGRDWLFDENNYHIDTSHLGATVRFSIELEDPEKLRKALDLTEYGRRLSPMFQYRNTPPFEDTYVDYGIYIRALLKDSDAEAVTHFKQKLATVDPDEINPIVPAQILVGLLARMGRFEEAIEVSENYLQETHLNDPQLACPPLAQLCLRAGKLDRLKELAKERDDLVSFAAANF